MEWHYYGSWNGFVFTAWVFGGLVIYFLPSIVAFFRKHVQAAPIFILNLFLGWTLIGWIGCLAWAVSANTRQARTG